MSNLDQKYFASKKMVKKSVRNLDQNISLQRNGVKSVSNLDQNNKNVGKSL